MSEISITQFEALVTQRVLYRSMSASALRNGFQRNDLIFKSSYTANEVLKDYGLGEDCQCQIRNSKVFMFHKKNRRIIAQLALSADVDPATGLLKRPQFYLLDRKGFIKNQPLSQLAENVGRLGKYERNRHGHKPQRRH